MNPQHLDLVSLRIFVSVARNSSMSAGATACHLSVAAVSKRIAELETVTSCRLLQRSSSGVTLTPEGRALLHHALKVLQDIDQLSAELTDFSEGVTGHVRILANPSAVLQGLPEKLAKFAKQHPNVRLDFEEKLSADVTRAIGSGRADVGVFADNVPYDDLNVSLFDDEELVLIAPVGHLAARRKARHLGEVLEFDFVSQFDSAALNSVLSLAAAENGRPLKLRYLMRGYDSICDMVSAGLGLSVIPRSAANRQSANELRVIRLKDHWARRRLLVGIANDNNPSAATIALFTSLGSPP